MLTESNQELFNSCMLTTEVSQLQTLDNITAAILLNFKSYQLVERFVSIPWPLIAAIHFRESGLSFKAHLHNGDPLTAKTIRVPKDRPEMGRPPFTWVESAVDALEEPKLPPNWAMGNCLDFLERYNGTGYRKHGIASPYLWDYTNHYTKGLYVSDGTFSPDKAESRPGCVSILLALNHKGVSLDFSSMLGADDGLH